MSFRGQGLAVGTVAALALAAPAAGSAPAQRAVPARIQGTFAIVGTVTTAVRVRGEHAGQVVRRLWVITPLGCRNHASSCPRLRLVRHRSGGRRLAIVLHRHRNGAYRGRGTFYVPLRCGKHLFGHGAKVPYLITLRATNSVQFGPIRLATRISASYYNRSRRDLTRCPLGPSHDAAVYKGLLVGPV